MCSFVTQQVLKSQIESFSAMRETVKAGYTERTHTHIILFLKIKIFIKKKVEKKKKKKEGLEKFGNHIPLLEHCQNSRKTFGLTLNSRQ